MPIELKMNEANVRSYFLGVERFDCLILELSGSKLSEAQISKIAGYFEEVQIFRDAFEANDWTWRGKTLSIPLYFILCDLISSYDMNVSAMIRLLDNVHECRVNRLRSMNPKVQKIRFESLKIQHENRTNGIIRKANDIICFLRDLFTVFQGAASLADSDTDDETDEGGNAGSAANVTSATVQPSKEDTVVPAPAQKSKTSLKMASLQPKAKEQTKPKLVLEMTRKQNKSKWCQEDLVMASNILAYDLCFQ